MRPPRNAILQGDAMERLAELPDACVQLCLTSPPYWGLRDYRADGKSLAGQWGREATPEEHIARMVTWGREARRVLRRDGVLVLNYGESYAATRSRGSFGDQSAHGYEPHGNERSMPPGLKQKDLIGMPWRIAAALQADGWWWRCWWPWVKLNGMPESTRDRPALSVEVMLMFTRRARYYWDQEAIRVGYAAATLADGRTAEQGERKERQYPGAQSRGATNLSNAPRKTDKQRGHGRRHDGFNDRWDAMPKAEQQAHGRIRKTGDWWRDSLASTIAQTEAWLAHARAVQAGEVPMLLDFDGFPLGQLHPTYAYPGSHFATYPPALVRPIIRAATSERGQCPACGAPWVRVVEVDYTVNKKGHAGRTLAHGGNNWDGAGLANLNRSATTTGWAPSCRCDAGEPVPQIVLDPFAGTGTTCVVAAEEGRDSIGIDLYGGDYDFGGHTAMDRLRAALGTGPPLEAVAAEAAGQTRLFEE